MGLVKSGGYKEIFVNCIAGKNEPVLGVAENLSFHTWGVGRWRGVWKPSGRLTLSAQAREGGGAGTAGVRSSVCSASAVWGQ